MNFSPGLNTNVIENNSLVPFAFDYISADYSGSVTDVYTYKSGGAGGTTVAVVTITWTSTTKDVLVSVLRT